jgi:hypothetical protein
MYLDSSSVSETWLQVQFFKKNRIQCEFQFWKPDPIPSLNHTKPKWAFLNRQSGYPAKTDPKHWSKRKILKCEKKVQKKIGWTQPIHGINQNFKNINIKNNILIFMYVCMFGTLKYPWQEKTWHKQSCSKTLLHLNRLLSFLTPVVVWVSLWGLIIASTLLLHMKWEKPNATQFCCIPYAKWWVKKLSAYSKHPPLHFCCTILNEWTQWKTTHEMGPLWFQRKRS